MDAKNLSVEAVELIFAKQNYTKKPNVAIAAFHCCSGDPNAFLSNDEQLKGPQNQSIRDRISKVIGSPVGMKEARECHEKALEIEKPNVRIVAFASCNECISDGAFVTSHISDIHDDFILTDDETEDNSGIPPEILQKHCMVYPYNEKHYHLNPDLVHCPSKIILCKQCHKDPRKKGLFSIANGHDYGLYSDLPELSIIAKACICPARIFNIDLKLRSNHSSANAIVYPSDGPPKCSAVLPVVDESLVHITFLGPREDWRLQKQNFRHLYDLPAKDIYPWFTVFKPLHFEYKNIRIDSTASLKKNGRNGRAFRIESYGGK